MAPKVVTEGTDLVATSIFCPGASGMPMLDGFGKMYDRYRVNNIVLSWKTSVGTTTAGSVVLGVDGGTRKLPSTLIEAQAMWPKWRGPLWAEGSVSPNLATLMPQRWLNTTTDKKEAIEGYAAFAAVIAIVGGVKNLRPGDVWCRYDVEFAYPTGASTSGG